jgi:hypothetical protein
MAFFPFSTSKKMLPAKCFFAVLLVFTLSTSFGQVYSDKVVGKKTKPSPTA